MSKEEMLKKMQKYAKNKNGECLSKEYIGVYGKYQWQCEFGHVWKTAWANIFHGNSWCPYCAGNISKTIEDAQDLAEKNSGKCLSKVYINAHTNLKWKCNECNGVWEATYSNVQNGTWCPHCYGNAKKTIQDMQEVAKKKGGKCLSQKYINNRTKLKWECLEGHTWKATPGHVINGTWCPHCAGQIITLKNMQKIAEERNGECLSKKYINANTKLQWQCSEGHTWEATPSNIQQGYWCPYCAGVAPATIEEMQELAEENNGGCLSDKYISDNTKLQWQCKYGHVWWAKPTNIKQGKWCPYCHKKSENKFREVIEKVLCAKFPTKRPEWLINNQGNRLELDGYNRTLKVAFEYQGMQHFQPIYNDYFGGKKALIKRQKHDKIKQEVCKKRGIILLCPTYELNEEQYEEFIKNNVI